MPSMVNLTPSSGSACTTAIGVTSVVLNKERRFWQMR